MFSDAAALVCSCKEDLLLAVAVGITLIVPKTNLLLLLGLVALEWKCGRSG